jgi:aryl-phospho-beta-D-glucosidase BglC (GH1 family)
VGLLLESMIGDVDIHVGDGRSQLRAAYDDGLSYKVSRACSPPLAIAPGICRKMKKYLKKLDQKYNIQDTLGVYVSSSPSQGAPPLPQGPQPQLQHIPPPPPGPAPAQSQAQASRIGPPTKPELLRYRLHHGCNLGSIFVLERWLAPPMFLDSAVGGSELSAVTAYIAAHGLDATRQKWEEHWNTAVTPSDWEELRRYGVTSVRLPIGFFTLGPQFCASTPFESVAGVYVNAWEKVRTYIQAAASHGIAVLLDLHALPGGQNDKEHSGTDSGKAEFWGNSGFQQLATSVLAEIARRVAADPVMREWVLGIQLMNEAAWGAEGKGLFSFYDATVTAIAAVDPTLPVYISDAWNTDPVVQYALGKNQTGGNPVVVDTHKYFCFTEQQKKLPPRAIINSVSQELVGTLSTHRDTPTGIVVGEWSVAMTAEAWGFIAPASRPELTKQFGHLQCQRWERDLKPLGGGGFFWTLKGPPDWGFLEQCRAGNIPAPLGFALTPEQKAAVSARARESYSGMHELAVGEHVEYWSANAEGDATEYWRYGKGYQLGYWDSVTFFEDSGTGGSIGFVGLWVRKRRIEHTAECGEGRGVWEFEHGVRRGIADIEGIIQAVSIGE